MTVSPRFSTGSERVNTAPAGTAPPARSDPTTTIMPSGVTDASHAMVADSPGWTVRTVVLGAVTVVPPLYPTATRTGTATPSAGTDTFTDPDHTSPGSAADAHSIPE